MIYIVLCNQFPNISFTVKKTKILIKIMWHDYLALKNYIIQYKLQYIKHDSEQNNIKERKTILRCSVANYLIL